MDQVIPADSTALKVDRLSTIQTILMHLGFTSPEVQVPLAKFTLSRDISMLLIVGEYHRNIANAKQIDQDCHTGFITEKFSEVGAIAGVPFPHCLLHSEASLHRDSRGLEDQSPEEEPQTFEQSGWETPAPPWHSQGLRSPNKMLDGTSAPDLVYQPSIHDYGSKHVGVQAMWF